MPVQTGCYGIHQSGFILQSAIRAALADLRAKPYLLDYCFAGMAQDQLTADEYGDAEIERAKQWFLGTDIKVFLTSRNNTVTFPCISLKVLSSNEAENTLGDVNVDPFEDGPDLAWPVLAGPLDALHYDPATGKLTIPTVDIVTAAGQVVVTKAGKSYDVLDTPDYATLVLDKNIVDDFGQMTIRGQKPGLITSLESAHFAETYMIGCHVQGEGVYATYLHSILVFSLLMYRQSLLEKRNFERSSLASTGEGEREETMNQEIVWSRYLQLSGYVRNMWPKNISPRVTAVAYQPRIIGTGAVAVGDEVDAPWVGDGDVDFLTLMSTRR